MLERTDQVFWTKLSQESFDRLNTLIQNACLWEIHLKMKILSSSTPLIVQICSLFSWNIKVVRNCLEVADFPDCSIWKCMDDCSCQAWLMHYDSCTIFLVFWRHMITLWETNWKIKVAMVLFWSLTHLKMWKNVCVYGYNSLGHHWTIIFYS